MAFLQISLRGSGDKPAPGGAPPAWGFVGRDESAAAVRAGLPFQDLVFARERLETLTPAGLAQANCELLLSASDTGHDHQNWLAEGLFGDDRDALRCMGASAAVAAGEGVNVVIVDHGLSRNYLALLGHEANYQGGWVSADPEQPAPGEYSDPYSRQPDWHGNMIARNILRVAPAARIYDAPLLPARIDDIDSYTGHAELLFEAIQSMIRHAPVAPGPWVIVNAWAVADSSSEHGSGAYTNNPGHRLVALVREMAETDGVAFVFAAGNNGQFGGDPRNGTYDTGPGRSILGVNGLAQVLTVGAMRTDGLWIGASSQGPGPDKLGWAGKPVNQKPDLCAPSWFSESRMPDVPNTGTSASCGLAAGMVAREWSARPGETALDLFAAMRKRARAASGQDAWSPRTGMGMLVAD